MAGIVSKFIVGIDEAGRGPLAGPVVAAAVILNPLRPILGLTDSKKLTEKKRAALFDEIRHSALVWSVARATVAEIDTINILQASLLAMQRAVNRLPIMPDLALVDGNKAPWLACETRTIIQGDLLEPAISAASIVAKVLRDRAMCLLDRIYPDYGFAQHKGYGTLYHREMITKFGICRAHRRSFAPVAQRQLIAEID